MASKDYYSILGLQRNATDQEIKSAFRKLSKKYHPDICKEEGAEEKFKEINEAYTILSDSEKKQMYDTYGTVDLNDINFGNMGGGFGFGFNPFDPFGHFRQGTTNSQMKEKGDDLRITVNVSFDDIFYGTHKKIKMTKKCACHRCNGSGSDTNETVTCPRCQGSGTITETVRRGNMIMQNMGICPDCHGTGQIIKNPCPNCHGTGLESKQVDVEFDIPAGMYENAYFIVKGKGNDAPHRGIPGDLLVLIKEKPNEKGLKRDENNNILYTARVPYKTMVFGGDITVPYVGNTTKTIHVNSGTESGKVVKLFSLGFPDPNQPSIKANYIITLECDIPKPSELSSELKKALQDS